MKPVSLIWIIFCLLAAAVPAGGRTALKDIGDNTVRAAEKALAPHPIEACLTNAGTARLDGDPCTRLLDSFSGPAKVSLGRGTLMPVHGSWQEAPWAAFVSRPSKDELLMVMVKFDSGGPVLSAPVNVRVKAGTSFAPFQAALGSRAFALVTLANGWADGLPREFIAGALFHDHLCCGVSTGYLTARYILDQFPLSGNQSYVYIGTPAWCQDDLIMTALNLTPGKHGYVTMAYPWNRPWQTDDAAYAYLGGIIIRRDSRDGGGEARVLAFDWQFEAFREFAGLGTGPLDWKNRPWLHVLYNRFLASRLDRPGAFVSVVKTKHLETGAEVEALVRLGANPLESLLGADPGWKTTP